jgi:hypothetical protein
MARKQWPQCACSLRLGPDGKCPAGCEAFRKPGKRRIQLEATLKQRERAAMSRTSIPSAAAVREAAARALGRR